MSATSQALTRTMTASAAVALGLALAAGPAGAEPPSHAKAPQGAAVTEDDDTNDKGTPNNVVDDGDNEHPSGKDRSVEAGGSGNQGKAASDPDDDGRGPDRSNGGADKPDGPGGHDLADQDGNNGCGNDDDFEDDNEGWCGQKPRKNAPAPSEVEEDEENDGGGNAPEGDTPTPVYPPAEVASSVAIPGRSPNGGQVDVIGAPTGNAIAPERVLSNVGRLIPTVLSGNAVAPSAGGAEVLGDVTYRTAAGRPAAAPDGGGVLARTGVELLTLAGLGVAATTAGVLARRAGRNRQS